MAIEKDLLKHVYAKLDIHPETMCCHYTGGTNGQGYGRIYHQGKMYGVHRLIFEVFHGPIPQGKEVHHTCGVRSCCNVAHLELVSHRENVVRIGRYESLRLERLQDLLAVNFDLALFGITRVTSRDFQNIWGRSCRGGNIVSYLKTLAFVFGDDFQWVLVRRGRGRSPHLYEIRMTRQLIERLEKHLDDASQPALDSLAGTLAQTVKK